MPLPAVGAILAKLATAGKAVAGKVAAGAAAKGAAAGGAAAAAGGGAATAGGATGWAAKAAATASLVKELAVDIPSNIHSASVLSDAAQGANNAREYTRMLGPQQAAQALPQDLPRAKTVREAPVWKPKAPPQAPPAARPAPPRVPKIPTGGTPPTPTGAKPRGFFENVGERFNQWRQARAAQAATPQQLKMPSTRIPKGADFQEKLQKVARNLKDTDPIRSNAPSLPTAQDDQGEQERKAAAAQHGEGGIKKTGLSMGMMTIPPLFILGLHKATQGIEKWTTGLMESYRPMERLNAAIATTFAKLERQGLVLTARTAKATSGTTAALGEELAGLREDMQPMREASVQLRNLVQLALVRAARYGALLLQFAAKYWGVLQLLRSIDDSLKKDEELGANAWANMFAEMVKGNFDRPQNRGPGGGP